MNIVSSRAQLTISHKNAFSKIAKKRRAAISTSMCTFRILFISNHSSFTLHIFQVISIPLILIFFLSLFKIFKQNVKTFGLVLSKYFLPQCISFYYYYYSIMTVFIWRILKSLTVELLKDSVFYFCIYAVVHTSCRVICIFLFISALFSIERTYNKTRCTSADEWITKLCAYIKWNIIQY